MPAPQARAHRTRRAPRQGGHLIIPDLHGHLPRLLAALKVAQRLSGARLVFLGDLIDDAPWRRQARGDRRSAAEGDDSPEILRRVQALHAAGQADIVLGNHEVMAIAAVLDGNEALLDLWWRVGGRATAGGYGWQLRNPSPLLQDDLAWLREEGRLWHRAGPPEREILAVHATRPNPERVTRGLDRYAHLSPSLEDDPALWFPLGDPGCGVMRALPEGMQASVHGHMQGAQVRTLTGPDGWPAYQLDLDPACKRLALLHVDPEGERRLLTMKVR